MAGNHWLEGSWISIGAVLLGLLVGCGDKTGGQTGTPAASAPEQAASTEPATSPVQNTPESSTEEKVSVPSVVGMSSEEAATQMQSVNLLWQSTEKIDAGVPRGQVVSQDPAAGVLVAERSTVTLQVAGRVHLPNVMGMPQANAAASLQSARLKFNTTQRAATGVPAGNVIEQKPEPGALVTQDTVVQLVVAVAPPPPPPARSKVFSLAGGSVSVSAGGGRGGGPFVDHCPTGSVAVGFNGRSGAFVDQIQLLCSPINSNGTLGPRAAATARGGGGGRPFSQVCPGGQALIGLVGRSGAFVDQLGGHCVSITSVVGLGGGSSKIGPAGGNGGGPFSRACPNGLVMTGIYGGSGKFLDRIGFYCRRLTRQ